MAKSIVPHFHNDPGVPRIDIGVKEFMCIGATAPYDHPHVYLDMGDETEKVCPYCSTLFVYDKSLSAIETNPAGCLIEIETGETDTMMKDPPIADNQIGEKGIT